ncbi:glycolipid anchored surface protein GAS1, partial [Ascobolus immersus RN42]
AFFVGNERFYIRGVDYQPGGQGNLTDPLSNYDICSRDIPVFKELGLNTVRIYTVDNSKDHSKCMQLLADAGIYLILDVNTPKLSLNREYPKETYNDIYLQHVFATIDVMSKYENTLGFFAANEVLNDEKVHAAPYVKAIIRDMKAYIKKQIKRQIPVGYSAADVASNRMQMAQYLNCGDKAEERVDFYGINDYSWCGASSFTVSGYNEKVQNFTDYSVPLFFSEYGCNTVGDSREFSEVKSIYSTQMTGVFSGGLVYEYTQEDNDYGLVEVQGDKVVKFADFDNLKKQFSTVKNPSGDGGYKKNGKPSACPPKSKDWDFTPFDTLPAMPAGGQKLIDEGAGKPRGI